MSGPCPAGIASGVGADWPAPPAALVLGPEEVHVWRAALDRRPGDVWDLLSPAERRRAARFDLTLDRERFVAARGHLRAILARYTGLDPAALRLEDGPYGKPALAVAAGPPTIRFNLAHADCLALVAVARGREVGIDLEPVRPDFDWQAVAAGHFAGRELVTVLGLPAADRPAAFFACWALKEAFAKAVGLGLALPPEQIGVEPDPPGGPCLRAPDDPITPGTRWHDRLLAPGPGYVAALVVAGPAPQLRTWTWSDDGRVRLPDACGQRGEAVDRIEEWPHGT